MTIAVHTGVATVHHRRCVLGCTPVTTYAGPATLVLEDGRQFAVNVALHSSDLMGHERWWGALGTAHVPSVWRSATLRLPDGQEGRVVSALSEALGGRVLQLTGSGPAPS